MHLLTIQGGGEVRLTRFKDIDGDGWTISAEFLKNGPSNRVPLSPQAQEMIEKVKRFIRTTESIRPAVEIHKELSEVERAFSGLKDVMKMPPIYHQKTHRTETHTFIASLAFLLDRALERKLKSAGKEAWQLLKTVRVVYIDLSSGESKRSVTQGSGQAARILKTVRIQDLVPDALKAKNKAA